MSNFERYILLPLAGLLLVSVITLLILVLLGIFSAEPTLRQVCITENQVHFLDIEKEITCDNPQQIKWKIPIDVSVIDYENPSLLQKSIQDINQQVGFGLFRYKERREISLDSSMILVKRSSQSGYLLKKHLNDYYGEILVGNVSVPTYQYLLLKNHLLALAGLAVDDYASSIMNNHPSRKARISTEDIKALRQHYFN